MEGSPQPTSTALLCVSDDPQLDPRQWSVVLRPNKDKVVLYSASRNRLSVQTSWQHEINETYESHPSFVDEEGLEIITSKGATENASSKPNSVCPLCLRTLSRRPPRNGRSRPTKDAHYFALLSQTSSRVNSPRNTAKNVGATSAANDGSDPRLDTSTLNTDYFRTFFEELKTLGKGGNGTVYLVRHVLNSEALGLYACKKIAVGNSSPSLLRILREVHLLEAIQHQNIINYHHAWVENSSFSSFGPPTPTLHILMAYANGGSLDSFILQRKGNFEADNSSLGQSKRETMRLYRDGKFGAVHLLRLDEIVSLFGGVCAGLAFLHRRNILHLDLKAENVLLHWDEEDSLLPCAKLSDFGSAELTEDAWHTERSSTFGTLDWMAPESWNRSCRNGKLPTPDRSTDQWALGLILHLLSYFSLPYRNVENISALEAEIQEYPGFFPENANTVKHGVRHDLPSSLIDIMTKLININPTDRPSCEKVIKMLDQVRGDPVNKLMAGSYKKSSDRFEATALIKNPFFFTAIAAPAREIAVSEMKVAPVRPTLESKSVFVHNPKTTELRRKLSLIPSSDVRATFLALLRLASLQRKCKTAPLSYLSIYVVVFSTIFDLTLQDLKASTLLVCLHVLLLSTTANDVTCVRFNDVYLRPVD